MRKIDVVRHFGNSTKLAKALGITKGSVSQWKDEIPKLRAYEIEKITGGIFKVVNPPEEYKKAS
jgi:DNA-binding transcriptional regulator YdaS (Cro superfamily)